MRHPPPLPPRFKEETFHIGTRIKKEARMTKQRRLSHFKGLSHVVALAASCGHGVWTGLCRARRRVQGDLGDLVGRGQAAQAFSKLGAQGGVEQGGG